jgi:hypothetical protein
LPSGIRQVCEPFDAVTFSEAPRLGCWTRSPNVCHRDCSKDKPASHGEDELETEAAYCTDLEITAGKVQQRASIRCLRESARSEKDKENLMKKEIGLWLDHQEAIVVSLTDGREEVKHIRSGSGKHMRYSGSSHSKTPVGLKEVTSEDQRDRKFGNQLNQYYDEIIAAIHDADSIQIFGPGEAKGELEKRLEHEGLKAHTLAVETADKMTDRQISAKVRQNFLPERDPRKVLQHQPARNDEQTTAKKERRGYHEQ